MSDPGYIGYVEGSRGAGSMEEDSLKAQLAQAQACIRDSWRGLKRAEWKQLHAQAIARAREPTAALGEPEE